MGDELEGANNKILTELHTSLRIHMYLHSTSIVVMRSKQLLGNRNNLKMNKVHRGGMSRTSTKEQDRANIFMMSWTGDNHQIAAANLENM
jgi:hypothetical protein